MDMTQLNPVGWEDRSRPVLSLSQAEYPLDAQRQAVMDVSITLVSNKPSSFSLQVNSPDLELIQGENAVFGLGKQLAIGLGYTPQFMETEALINGEITAVGVDLDESGGFTCRVEGFDLLHKTTRGMFEDSFFDVTVKEMAQRTVRKMQADCGQSFAFIPDDSPWNEALNNQIQNNESHFAFLEKLAEKYGYQFWVNGTALFFQEQRSGLHLDLTWGQNLLSFSTRLSTASLIGKVEARFAGQTVTAEMETMLKGAYAHLPAIVQQRLKDDKPATTVLQLGNTVRSHGEAKRLAEVELERNCRNLLEVDGSCIGNPDVQPGTIFKLKGMLGFDGEYVVESATHTLNQSGYRTSFSMKPDFSKPPRKSGG